MRKKKGDKRLVPALRFSEFEGDGEWNKSTIEDISSIASGGTPSRKEPEYWNGNIPWISTTLIDFNNIKEANEFITTMGLKNSSTKVFLKGTILMAMYGQGKTRGKVAILGIKATINQACAAITLNEGMNTEFVFQNLASRYDEIRGISNQGGQKNLSGALIKKIPFSYPDIESNEQQKIANTLTSLDNMIAAHHEKLDALQAHKKGLLQQLFPAKGEIVPKLRFGEFAGEWEEKELLDITDKKIKWSFTGGPFGSSLKSSDYIQGEKGVRIIQLQNIGDGRFKNNYKIFTSEEKANELISNNIYPGDIIMSKMGDPVGRACLIPDFHDRYVMASDGIRVVVDENKFDKYFIYSLINSKDFRTKIENSSTGSTRKRIGLSVLKRLTFYVPKNKEEQQKISNCLSSFDDKIATQSEKITILKEHKKGLMQQLFPNISS